MSSATRRRPSSRAGGDLQTWAVMVFWRLVDLRDCRALRRASQTVLILEILEVGVRAEGVVVWSLVLRYIV